MGQLKKGTSRIAQLPASSLLIYIRQQHSPTRSAEDYGKMSRSKQFFAHVMDAQMGLLMNNNQMPLDGCFMRGVDECCRPQWPNWQRSISLLALAH
jgi:hypothetical protein